VIVERHQLTQLTIISVARRIDIPLLWSAQQQVLGLHIAIYSPKTIEHDGM
jgi:hypothetical protein